MQTSAAIIGAGNVAWHLAPALDNIGCPVTEVMSRTRSSAKNLIKRLYQANAIDTFDLSEYRANIIFLCVPDDQIEEVADQLLVPQDKIVVHTSGAKSIDSLEYRFDKAGVFYPLQTFSKNKKVDFKDIPILVEGSDDKTENVLFQIANSLSKKVHKVSSDQRRHVHVAAVFACNFTNHMLSISEDLLKKQKLDLSLLHPLISETINKALDLGPKQAQTGPARRQDLKTLDKHMDMLKHNEMLSEIYRLVSQHIIDDYN